MDRRTAAALALSLACLARATPRGKPERAIARAHVRRNTTSCDTSSCRMRRLALLNAQWRGGSTLAEQLFFSTTIAPPFLLDEPAKAMWLDDNRHKVSSVNFNALRCDFSQFNHTHLLSWQHWRGEYTRQRRLLNHRSFAEMRRRCFTGGNGGGLRALKTIRMTGELELFAKKCQHEKGDTGANYSCVLIQLVRHPLSTVRSERNSARLPQARGVLNPTLVAPGQSTAWMEGRTANMTGFCEPILKDLKAALSMQQRAARLARKGLDTTAVPRVVVVNYDQLLSRPAEVGTAHQTSPKRTLSEHRWRPLQTKTRAADV